MKKLSKSLASLSGSIYKIRPFHKYIKKEPDEHLVIRPFTEINNEKSHQLEEILTDIPLRASNFK
ncbi:MAG: hypothetical protein ACI4NC_00905, partial [Succinivibrio sp.]